RVANIRTVVVLPDPFGPSSASTVPRSRRRSRPSTAAVVSNRLVSAWVSIAASVMTSGDGAWTAAIRRSGPSSRVRSVPHVRYSPLRRRGRRRRGWSRVVWSVPGLRLQHVSGPPLLEHGPLQSVDQGLHAEFDVCAEFGTRRCGGEYVESGPTSFRAAAAPRLHFLIAHRP